MKRTTLFLMIILLIASCGHRPLIRMKQLPRQPISEIPAEIRGIWVTRYNWADANPDSMKQKIIHIMDNVAGNNFNAVFFQVRGQAETLYPSPIEPWSKLVGGKDPGFDPVEMAIKEAHARGLAFYAYINLLPLWNEESPPADSSHLYYRHGPHVSPEQSWVCFDQTGKPMALNEYYYLNPALPPVKSYLKKVIRQFVENYDIDGIHFDRIRYPGPNYLFDPYSLKNFHADSLKSPLSRPDWARQTLTDLVEDVVAEALLIKPYLVISAATWGLYRTDDMEGYQQFGSGYTNYYQDAIDWLNKGIMDFIVPMAYWDINDPPPNFHQVWFDLKKRTPLYQYIFPGIRLRSQWIDNAEIVSQVNFLRQNGGKGHVMFSYSDLKRDKNGILRKIIFPHRTELPTPLKRISAEQIVSLCLPEEDSTSNESITVTPYNRSKIPDADGWIGLILPEKPTAFSVGHINVRVKDWYLPYRYVLQTDGNVKRQMPWVEFRRLPADTTLDSLIYPLAKTSYPAHTSINNDSVKIYRTGIFFDEISLKPGLNRIKASIISPDSGFATYEKPLIYQKRIPRSPLPLWIDSSSVTPRYDLTLLPEDHIPIGFTGSKGQQAFVEVQPGKIKLPMQRTDYSDFSRYETSFSLKRLKMYKEYKLAIVLESPGKSKLKLNLKSQIKVQDSDNFPLVVTTDKYSIFRYNLGQIRLGGPIIAEYPAGVVLKVNGKVGDNYRIFLNSIESGFIEKEEVKILPAESIKPGYYLQNLTVLPTDDADVVTIPYLEPVPYAVYPEPDQNRIKISLYGVKTSSTWLIHRQNLKIINKVTWQQVTPETYQIIVNLKSSKIWGYECKPYQKTLSLRVKYPPAVEKDQNNNYPGLKVAIEAGHGGRSIGAVGLSGLEEKDINLDVARKLADICRSNGIDVLQVRNADVGMYLTTKRDTVEKSDADVLVSIHANYGNIRNGYLGVSGASTYYNNPFWADFGRLMQSELVDLGLNDFGTVGSFNYIVIRVSSRPTILVEQAFMSNAEDEEKLFSEDFRRQMAQNIFHGIMDYVDYMLDAGD
jgi:N-acetylmuramoyl-L-alanine amidase